VRRQLCVSFILVTVISLCIGWWCLELLPVVLMCQGDGPGYFKLQLGQASSSSSSSEERVLVVAFGSAPGLPNWGGVMRQVSAAAEAPEHK
jgi:hypothetical protein